MTTKKMILAGLVACSCIAAKGQDAAKKEPKGKAIVQVFGNFHTGFGQQNDNRGFELDRSYLGYQYSLGKGLTIKGVMDIGKSSDVDDYQRIAYIKNAMVTWKTGKLTLNGGLISTTQFNMVEKFWGYRYIYKSFQDQYKFGSSADLGLSASYAFTPWLQTDAIIVNGEGYKKVQKNDGLAYGLGATLTPLKGLSVRLYAGMNEGVDKSGDSGANNSSTNTYNYSAFLGYKTKDFSIGAEYNIMQNAGNKEDADQYGVSVYGALKASKTTDAFVRYDNLSSKDDWNEAKDEQAIIAGAQFKLGEYVKIAPNFRMTMPKADGADEKYSAYVSCYFGW